MLIRHCSLIFKLGDEGPQGRSAAPTTVSVIQQLGLIPRCRGGSA